MTLRRLSCSAALWVLCGAISGLAQSADTAAIQQKLDQAFVQTRFKSDWSAIIQSGSIVTMKKDGVLMYQATVPAAPITTYKNGKLTQNFGDTFKVDMADGLGRAGGASSIPRKTLGAGDKCWVSDFLVKDDQVQIGLVTDPYDDGRYFGILKLQFPKKSIPSADDLMAMVSDVMDIDNSQAAGRQAPPGPQQPPAPQEPAQQALAPLAPPPPPADAPPPAPKTISLGMTHDQVVAALGPPQKLVKLGEKEIDYYPDMKVTFLDGQVADVQ